MKYKEVKRYYKSGQIMRHYFVDESGHGFGEYRRYHGNGQLCWHYFRCEGRYYGEVKAFNTGGTPHRHCLEDGKGNELATVVACGKPATNTEEQLIEIAKEHGLPLLSELPKSEAELTHWILKHPDIPLLPPVPTPSKPTQVGIINRIKQWGLRIVW